MSKNSNLETESLQLSAKEGYDRWSPFYDDDDIPLHLLENSVVPEELGSVNGLSVVDLGCGTGRQTFALQRRGAVVTGVDQSQGMLAQAKKKNTNNEVIFIQADLGQVFPLTSRAYDRVVSFLVLEHMENLAFFFEQCDRICKSKGWLYFTALHPAMNLKGVQARYTEKSGRKVYPRGWPYSISEYVNAGLKAGLQLEAIGEYAPSEQEGALSERAQKYIGWPLLLTLKFRPSHF